MTMRTIALALALGICGGAAAAEPSFKQYPATPYTGPVAQADVSGKKAKLFRAALSSQAASGPNFAGRYHVANWDCGAGCLAFALVDAQSGKVWFPPFTVEAGNCGDACEFFIDFRRDSELFVVQGALNGDGAPGKHYFRWQGGQLVELDPPAVAGAEPVSLLTDGAGAH